MTSSGNTIFFKFIYSSFIYYIPIKVSPLSTTPSSLDPDLSGISNTAYQDTVRLDT